MSWMFVLATIVLYACTAISLFLEGNKTFALVFIGWTIGNTGMLLGLLEVKL